MTTTLGDTLRVARTARHLTLQEMETATGVGSSYLSRLERRRIEKPGAAILAKIADASGLPCQILLDMAGYTLVNEATPLSRTVLHDIVEAGTTLTDDDWRALRRTVERMAARPARAAP